MANNNPGGPQKSCPSCGKSVHARRGVCDCGHDFKAAKAASKTPTKSAKVKDFVKKSVGEAVANVVVDSGLAARVALLESQVETLRKAVAEALALDIVFDAPVVAEPTVVVVEESTPDDGDPAPWEAPQEWRIDDN